MYIRTWTPEASNNSINNIFMLLISLPFNKVVRWLIFLFKRTIKCSNLTNDYHYPVHVSFCADENLLFS